MHTDYLIAIEEVCAQHHIEVSFVSSLQQNGLLEITTVKENRFVDSDQLQQLEKIVRLFYDLDINLEGIETIIHLLQRITNLQVENVALKNKLRRYQ